jgi:hypothetical protein
MIYAVEMASSGMVQTESGAAMINGKAATMELT